MPRGKKYGPETIIPKLRDARLFSVGNLVTMATCREDLAAALLELSFTASIERSLDLHFFKKEAIT